MLVHAGNEGGQARCPELSPHDIEVVCRLGRRRLRLFLLASLLVFLAF
jgi:hypothetical protein